MTGMRSRIWKRGAPPCRRIWQKRAEKHGEPQLPVRPEDLADAAARLQSAAPGSPAAEAALGRLLFLAAALGRSAGLDPEQALERANDAFIRDAAHIPTA